MGGQYQYTAKIYRPFRYFYTPLLVSLRPFFYSEKKKKKKLGPKTTHKNRTQEEIRPEDHTQYQAAKRPLMKNRHTRRRDY